MQSPGPAIGGRDYSVHNPLKVRLGLRLWTEAYIRAIREGAPPELDKTRGVQESSGR